VPVQVKGCRIGAAACVPVFALGGCRVLDGQFQFSEHQFGPAGAVLLAPLVIPGVLVYVVAREFMELMRQ
jgi:hypothetical protein